MRVGRSKEVARDRNISVALWLNLFDNKDQTCFLVAFIFARYLGAVENFGRQTLFLTALAGPSKC